MTDLGGNISANPLLGALSAHGLRRGDSFVERNGNAGRARYAGTMRGLPGLTETVSWTLEPYARPGSRASRRFSAGSPVTPRRERPSGARGMSLRTG